MILIGNTISISIDDMKENFLQGLLGLWVCNVIQLVETSNAYGTLNNNVIIGEILYNPFSLIIQGTCSLNKKVTNAKEEGFSACILYKIELLVIFYEWMDIYETFHLLKYVCLYQNQKWFSMIWETYILNLILYIFLKIKHD